MCTCSHRHSIFCVVPPYILRSISSNGRTQALKDAANRTLASDSTFRALRASLLASVPLEARRRRVLTPGPSKQRTIFSAAGQENLPGTVVRNEGAAATNDPAVDEAYDGLGHTFDFFWTIFQRNSIDDEGLPLNATVHFGDAYNNAFFNGRQMVFGDGDGDLFKRFTIALDVIGHELGHGVTEDETGLVYMFQSGALNEHLSDVWGSLIKQWVLNQSADQADWLIGAGLLGDTVQGVALRSMKDPGTAFDDPQLGKDPQPGHMNNFVETWRDNGGVHINSGIPNKAFFLVATELGGNAWEKAGKIWYATTRDARIVEDTKFDKFAAVTIDLAGRLPEMGDTERKVVADAWAAVGVVPMS